MQKFFGFIWRTAKWCLLGFYVIAALAAVFIMVSSRFIKRNAQRMERTFLTNFRSRELRDEYLGEKKPEYASHLLSKDMHFADFDIPAEIDWRVTRPCTPFSFAISG